MVKVINNPERRKLTEVYLIEKLETMNISTGKSLDNFITGILDHKLFLKKTINSIDYIT